MQNGLVQLEMAHDGTVTCSFLQGFALANCRSSNTLRCPLLPCDSKDPTHPVPTEFDKRLWQTWWPDPIVFELHIHVWCPWRRWYEKHKQKQKMAAAADSQTGKRRRVEGETAPSAAADEKTEKADV